MGGRGRGAWTASPVTPGPCSPCRRGRVAGAVSPCRRGRVAMGAGAVSPWHLGRLPVAPGAHPWVRSPHRRAPGAHSDGGALRWVGARSAAINHSYAGAWLGWDGHPLMTPMRRQYRSTRRSLNRSSWIRSSAR